MNYQVYTPTNELQAFVKCFWSLDEEQKIPSVRQRVVPDGCMEMIFHYGDLYRQYFENGSSILQPRAFIYGQISRFLEIEPTGISGIISARFFPEGLMPFVEQPISALQDKANDLCEIFGNHGKALENLVVQAPNNQERIKHIESFLLERLETTSSIDMITRSCVDVIMQSRGLIDVSSLSEQMNINRRSIERRFASVIGMSPKQLSRVVRLQSTIRILEQKNFTNLTALAYENGYYDQAHFIKDFKEFTGMSPKTFYAENLRLAAVFASAE